MDRLTESMLSLGGLLQSNIQNDIIRNQQRIVQTNNRTYPRQSNFPYPAQESNNFKSRSSNIGFSNQLHRQFSNHLQNQLVLSKFQIQILRYPTFLHSYLLSLHTTHQNSFSKLSQALRQLNNHLYTCFLILLLLSAWFSLLFSVVLIMPVLFLSVFMALCSLSCSAWWTLLLVSFFALGRVTAFVPICAPLTGSVFMIESLSLLPPWLIAV